MKLANATHIWRATSGKNNNKWEGEKEKKQTRVIHKHVFPSYEEFRGNFTYKLPHLTIKVMKTSVSS